MIDLETLLIFLYLVMGLSWKKPIYNTKLSTVDSPLGYYRLVLPIHRKLASPLGYYRLVFLARLLLVAERRRKDEVDSAQHVILQH